MSHNFYFHLCIFGTFQLNFGLSGFVDTLALASSLRDLTCSSRQARTAMWCALKVTLLYKDGVDVESDTEPDTDENETETEFDPEFDPDTSAGKPSSQESECPNPFSCKAA